MALTLPFFDCLLYILYFYYKVVLVTWVQILTLSLADCVSWAS